MNREKPICPKCASESVTADANAYWNAFGQCWELNNTFDTFWCEDCGSEIHPEWVGVEAA